MGHLLIGLQIIGNSDFGFQSSQEQKNHPAKGGFFLVLANAANVIKRSRCTYTIAHTCSFSQYLRAWSAWRCLLVDDDHSNAKDEHTDCYEIIMGL